MVYFYRSGKCRIPREKLQKLVEASNYRLNQNSLTFVKGNFALQMPTISEMNEDMAEFLGILYGDGCLGSRKFLVDISGDSKADLRYHKFRVAPLIMKLFGLAPRFKYETHAQEMHTLLTSKMVHSHISREFSFPIGYKKDRMEIPKIILQSDLYKKAFLRGLFDTDGGVHRHHKTSIQVQFTSTDPNFIRQVCGLFREFGYNARINGNDIQIHGKKEIDRFFQEINPKNPKHRYKFVQYKRVGVVPLHREIDYSVLNGAESIVI